MPNNQQQINFPEIIQQTIHEVYQKVRSPLPLVTASALSTISVACQGFLDVRNPVGNVTPTSLYLLTVAESGERKSSTDRFFSQPIIEFDQEQKQQARMNQNEFEAKQKIWEIKYKNVHKKICKTTKVHPNESTDDLLIKLSQILAEQPPPPQDSQIIYSDATIEALLYGLHSKGHNAILSSNEAIVVFNKLTTATSLGYLNTLWDGDSVHVERRSAKNFTIDNARLTLSLMIQPSVLKNKLTRNDSLARQSGFLSRMLISEPLSTQGQRFISGSMGEAEKTHLAQFHQKVKTLLKRSRDAKGQRIIIEFQPDAQNVWIDFYNTVEQQLNTDGVLCDIKDFSSKISNNMARIAALVHFFSEQEGKINYQSVETAKDLCIFHLEEFKKLFDEKSELDIQNEYACLLYQWLLKEHRKNGRTYFEKKYLYHYGPNKLRKRSNLEPAIQLLIQDGMIFQKVYQFGSRSEMIEMNYLRIPR